MNVGFVISMLVTSRGKIVDVGDQNAPNRHLHLKVVSDDSSPTHRVSNICHQHRYNLKFLKFDNRKNPLLASELTRARDIVVRGP